MTGQGVAKTVGKLKYSWVQLHGAINSVGGRVRGDRAGWTS